VAVAVLSGALALAGSALLSDFYRAELAVVELAGLAGGLAAAGRFAPGDYQRRAWILIASCPLLLLLGDLTLTTGVFSDRPWTPLANGILTVVANVGPVAGTWILARAWRVAGLELPGSEAGRVAARALVIALALAATGAPTLIELRALLAGDGSHLTNLASSVGDMITFSMIAPLFLTAVALRGGLLAWPFALLTASLFAWLGFDATITLAPLTGASDADVKVVLEVFRALAFTSGGAAGLAQRWAANAVRATTRSRPVAAVASAGP
jgi:hypothetical protein